MRTQLLALIIISVICCSASYAQKPNVYDPPMIHVEGGTFLMGNENGNSDEKPAHKVTVNSFYFGKYEVTFSDFKKFIDATGYLTDAEQPDTFRLKNGLPPRGINNGTWKMDSKGILVSLSDTMKPVGNVSWNDATAYLGWLSKATGKKFRLPTEAEWEYAAKGGDKSKGYKYVGGNNLNEVAWYGGNSDNKSHNIGLKMPNELEIYDMAGNIREWCSDWYGETYYKTSTADNPAGPDRGKQRVLRGGSWGSEEGRMRISYRNYEFPYNSALGFGFRPAITDEAAIKKAAPKPADDLMKDFDSKGFIDIYGINFDIGKATVKAESFPVIEQITSYLKEHPQVRIMIEGHTDNTGKDASNMTLSDKRAQSIKAEIIKLGIDAGRMETKGFGSSKPIADNKTAAGRTQNRRVTIKKL
ncbi:MAG: SUMF1/EgtB/PvdO family nonheme iron enzyme [Bacteroidetes bacterium]|nr:SUMF1/EgtB/PvdO family nonheme iron enzyme [Bacteroidota bacterium]